jgi:hypothetical protein
MAATVIINRWTGAGPTKTAITGINTRANAEDVHSTAGTTNSILIPAAPYNYSYWVNTRLEITAINLGTVDNIKWYTDGTNNFGTGVDCIGYTASVYGQASGTPGQSGTELTTTNYTSAGGTLNGDPVNVFTYKIVDGGSPASVSGSSSSTGDVGDFFVYQIRVADTALSGATGSETFTWKYDDTSS